MAQLVFKERWPPQQ